MHKSAEKEIGMKKNREELSRIHKEKCRELKRMRAKMAEDLGIDLKQRECTYEGYCSGTCPKCKSEEMMLNAAILKRQMEEAGLKKKVAAVGLTAAAAICLSGCTTPDSFGMEGGIEEYGGDVEYISGEVVRDTEWIDDELKYEDDILEGDVEYVDEAADTQEQEK